ncbi:MAG: amidohydrolase family protein [Bacteroidota bacterium]
MDLLLRQLTWHNGNEELSGDIRISSGVIVETGKDLLRRRGEHAIELPDHFIYPGLINAHDHLEMNLYPRLGSPPYQNYVQWANDIFKTAQHSYRAIEEVDIEDRLLWGGIKNLLAGVTTVVHHNPWHRILSEKKFPVQVVKISWAHSLEFEKKIRNCFPKKGNTPFVVHAAEGTDALAYTEISALDTLGLIQRNTTLVHAIAMSQADMNNIAQQQASIVWCPASNIFMFGKTADIPALKTNVRVALGSDSTMTGSPTLLHEIQFASKLKLVHAGEIYEMVTGTPARIFGLPGNGIRATSAADLSITPIKNKNYFENLAMTKPADITAVIRQGDVRLSDDKYFNKLPLKYTIYIEGAPKKISIDVAALKRKIERKVGTAILNEGELWRMIGV